MTSLNRLIFSLVLALAAACSADAGDGNRLDATADASGAGDGQPEGGDDAVIRDRADDPFFVPTADAANEVPTDDASDPSGDATADTDLDAALCAPRATPDRLEPWLVVGTGFNEHVAIDHCEKLPIILGIQGGSHIWGAFEAGGFAAETDAFFNIDFELRLGDEIVGSAAFVDLIRGQAPDGGPYQYHSVAVFLNENCFCGEAELRGLAATPSILLGLSLRMTMRLSRNGVVDLTDSVVIVPNETTL